MWRHRAFSLYRTTFSAAQKSPETYWAARAHNLSWDRPPSLVCDAAEAPKYRWFPDGELNMCYNCVDRHANSSLKDEYALIHDSPVSGRISHFSYSELLNEVQLLAGAFAQRHGVQKGDTVLIYTPTIPEGVVAMLACARLGAVHSVVFGGFSARELAIRIAQFKPKVIVTANWGYEGKQLVQYKAIIDSALSKAADFGFAEAEQTHCVVVNRRGADVPVSSRPKGDFDYHRELISNEKCTKATSVPSTHPLYVLFTSGTTGKPKGIIRDTGGYAVALNTAMEQVYGIGPTDVMWAASDLGWVVGHSCGVYGPLLRGATTVLYEGRGDVTGWWRVIATHEVKCVLGDPTSVRALKRIDPKGRLAAQYRLNTLKHFCLAGERCDPASLHWLSTCVPHDCLINDHWWQTETGWAVISNFMGLDHFETISGSSGKPVPGWNVQLLNEKGDEVRVDQPGKVCIAFPTPPGFMTGLWRENGEAWDKYMKTLPGYYVSGDEGIRDEDGYIHITSRLDDVIISGGKKLSPGHLEDVISGHPQVSEVAVIGVRDEIKGEVPVAFIVLKDRSLPAARVEKEVAGRIHIDIGGIAELAACVTVRSLPKTRSGKTLRSLLKQLAEKKSVVVPETMGNPEAVEDIKTQLEAKGFEPASLMYAEELPNAAKRPKN